MTSFDNDHISVGELFIVPAVSISGGFERFFENIHILHCLINDQFFFFNN